MESLYSGYDQNETLCSKINHYKSYSSQDLNLIQVRCLYHAVYNSELNTERPIAMVIIIIII